MGLLVITEITLIIVITIYIYNMYILSSFKKTKKIIIKNYEIQTNGLFVD